MNTFQPAYLALLETGELKRRASQAFEMMETCECCGHRCKSNRAAGKLGVCRTGVRAAVSSYFPHMGEEAPLTGWRGSGTIFFARCNLRCQYCQNFDISQAEDGVETGGADLSQMMLELQAAGCHNINLVSPTHASASILEAVAAAAEKGLSIPLVYNTGGYDTVELLQLYDGIVDIYMPDMKYASAQAGLHYSKARNYPSVNQAAVKEMHRQVGDLKLDERGIAQRGLLIRHLILPNQVAGTRGILEFIAAEISKETYVNIMDQYHPAYRASLFPKINRRPKREEIIEAASIAKELGLVRGDR